MNGNLVGAKSLMNAVLHHGEHHAPHRLLSIKHRSKLKLLAKHHSWMVSLICWFRQLLVEMNEMVGQL